MTYSKSGVQQIKGTLFLMYIQEKDNRKLPFSSSPNVNSFSMAFDSLASKSHCQEMNYENENAQ